MSWSGKLLTLLAFWSALCPPGNCQSGRLCPQLIGRPSCVCEHPDGKGIIDLTSIAKTGLEAPSFTDLIDPGSYKYSYNPCYPYKQDLCNNVHSCQTSDYNPYVQYEIASGGTEKIYIDDKGVPFVYYTGPSRREVNVHLHCTNDRNVHVVTDGDQLHYFIYEFNVSGCAVCPGGCHGSGVAAGEAGIVIIVLLIVGIGVYFAMGVVIMRVKYNASGVDLIPNKQFWMSIPFLFKDGILLVISPCRKTNSTYSELKS